MGKGYAGLETFCLYMDMPPPMAEVTYNNTITCTLYNVYKEVASSDMHDARRSLRETIQECFSEEEICDAAVSCDDTWQRHGYASLNGVITSISVETGKYLAYECLVQNCKACEMSVSRKGAVEYDNFVREHDCPINHQGSAGAMEAIGVDRIFERSVPELKLRYTTYISDGDSKAYPSVVAANPYPGKDIIKRECGGRVEKRVGGRLCKFKKAHDSDILAHY